MKKASIGIGALLASLACVAAGCSNGRGAYETCEPGQCEGVDGCSEVRVEYVEGAAVAGICTNECDADDDCPLDVRGERGACAMFIGSTICFERCTTSADCPDDLGCVDRLTDAAGMTTYFTAVCLPVRDD